MAERCVKTSRELPWRQLPPWTGGNSCVYRFLSLSFRALVKMEPSDRERHDGTNIHAYDGNSLMRVCRRYLNQYHSMGTLIISIPW